MSQYDELLKTLDDLRKRTAQFRRVALHVHSPDSHDWGTGGDKALNDGEQFLKSGGQQDFIEHLKPHFNLVAITDHMKCSFASGLSKTSRGNDAFLILPGMEVNFKPEAAIALERLHLIVLLPEQSGPERFAEIFSGLDMPDDANRTGHEEVTGINLVDWVKRVHDVGGLCIAAHVDGNQGVRRHFRQTSHDILKLFDFGADEQRANEPQVSDELKEYLFEAKFDAIEIAKHTDKHHYRWVSEKDGQVRTIPTVLTFDAHCIERFARPERVTWIKMTRIGLNGLRDALKFPETRVRFQSDLPTPPCPRLLGIEIVGDEHSLFDNIRVAFAENLNCIIGPRGSGKSTIVEALRYVFGYNRTLRELDETDKLPDRIRSLQKANLTHCLIRVVFQTQAGDVRVLEATFDPAEDYATRVFGADGEALSVADVEAGGEYPLRLFGWSEIETLGRETARQRDLLDRLIPELLEVKHYRDEVRRNLRESRTHIETTITQLQGLFTEQGGLLQKFTEYKTAFDKLNTDKVKQHFSALDIAQAKQHVLALVRKNVEGLVTKLGELDVKNFREGLDEVLESAEQALRDWWRTEELAQLNVIDVETDVKKHLSAAAETMKAFATLLDEHIAAAKDEVQSIHVDLREAFADDSSMQRIADLRANAEKRLQRARALREEYLKKWDGLLDQLSSRKTLVDDLLACQQRIAGIRSKHNDRIERELNGYFGDRMKITLAFRESGDTRQFADALVKTRICASFATQYQKRHIADILTSHFNPVTLARALLRGDTDQISGKSVHGDPAIRISLEEAQKAIERWQPWAKDGYANVDALLDGGARLQTLMALQEVEWDDEETILLDGRPVGELSPGQRSSAMLPLIALAETTPLVIDQPEDNLDNRLVGQVLTDILGELKEKRQIIVCTHNPNIVVSGDAEQVIVLDAISNRRAKVVAHGSIDNDDIVKSVIEIMEGGEEAFLVRKKRYRL